MRIGIKKVIWGSRTSSANVLKHPAVLLGMIVTFGALLLYTYTEIRPRNGAWLRFVQSIEARSLDARFILRGARSHDERIVIVGLDEKTLQEVGAFPIPRIVYARMVDQLKRDGAKVVAFDENFPVPEKNPAFDALRKLETQEKGDLFVLKKIRDAEIAGDGDSRFGQSIKLAGNVILGHVFLDEERSRSVKETGAEQYAYTLSAHVFPWMQLLPGISANIQHIWETATSDSQDPTEFRQLNAAGVYSNLPVLADGAKSFGFFNVLADADGTIRRTPMLIRYRHVDKTGNDFDNFYPSLDFESVREFGDIKNEDIAGYMGEEGIDRIDLGSHKLNSGHDGTVVINYVGPYLTFKHYSMIDVVNNHFVPGTFKGRLVLFGATAVAIGDVRATPFHDADSMGVEMHASIIDNILHSNERARGFITRGYTEEMIDVLFILIFGLCLGYWFGRVRPLISSISAAAVLLVFSWVVYLAFAHFGMWLSFVIPAATLCVNYGTITSFRMIFEEREKRRVRRTFERYVSPGVIALLEKDPRKYFKTGGESKELTIMFSDIRSFTTISEGLTPDELVRLLNEYLGAMTDILFQRWGTLDKYIGDAIMGFWGSPFPQADHAKRACACALDMRAKLKELNRRWESEGRKQLAIGVGINTGEVNVGNMGSSKRFAWTVMGDNVNLASRLEGITKEYHVQCVVSESAYAACKDEFVFREIDRIRVKGKTLPVTIYELLDWSSNESLYTERIVRFSEALTAYRRQEWTEAIELFTAIKDKFPDDGPAATFIERSRELMDAPPERDWDGVYAMKTK